MIHNTIRFHALQASFCTVDRSQQSVSNLSSALSGVKRHFIYILSPSPLISAFPAWHIPFLIGWMAGRGTICSRFFSQRIIKRTSIDQAMVSPSTKNLHRSKVERKSAIVFHRFSNSDRRQHICVCSILWNL
ncbi:uncharacterized protein PHALS_15071 [Plasmopara halstedii]|uniref:Uncharacterized protein n=1 Tax=Plasmopara halstedii TaxID=4781 RepID=A0A0P1A9P7_PLAHL|nr:uncharacterized protein PHALS_15071 [Plasmopara halstedii]CEG37462.1 hypothetical protein PHALS_15071 [Plasmopara halstedii]|eukprot:XP_024573831.1 hypothetical protein PHALS_15071 [Plasmopara halstedii]